MSAERFEREYGCTETEWLRWLPGAVRAQPWQLTAPGRARVQIAAGQLTLSWTVLTPRAIGLVRMPRMAVRFVFDAVEAAEQREFLRYFDLYLQRGGG